MAHSYQLVMTRGPGPGQVYVLGADEITIGREIHSEINIVDQHISRSHAALHRNAGGYSIEDLRSTNGTFLNGEKLDAPRQLKDGDTISLGQYVVLTFHVLADETATARFRREKGSTAIGVTGQPQSQVFISYSRKDRAFVEALHAGIVENGIKAWVDWEGIPLSADWWAEIVEAIESADTFIFVISSDSLNSKVCADELAAAIENNKRLIPVLHREPAEGDRMDPKISSHNWVFMRSLDELRDGLPDMVRTINTDLDWVRLHTRLVERAVEWERQDKDSSFLLRGSDLEAAEGMVAEESKEPALTSLQVAYVQAGQALREAELQEELEAARVLQEQAEARERATRRFLTIVSVILSALTCAATGLFAGLFEIYAIEGQESTAIFISDLSTYSILPAILGMGLGLVAFRVLRFRRQLGSFHVVTEGRAANGSTTTAVVRAGDPGSILGAYRRARLLLLVFFIGGGIGSAVIQLGDEDYFFQLGLTLCFIPLLAGGAGWLVYLLYRGRRYRKARKQGLEKDPADISPSEKQHRGRTNRALSGIVLAAGAVVGLVLSTAMVVALNDYGDFTFLSTLNLITIFLALFGGVGSLLVQQFIALRASETTTLGEGMREAAGTGAVVGALVGVFSFFGLGGEFIPNPLAGIWYLDNLFGWLLGGVGTPAVLLAIVFAILYIPWHGVKRVFRRKR